MLTIGSLFSGIGGLELGLEWGGLGPVLWQVEKDPFCRAVLAKHWPGAERHEDVRAASASVLRPVDLICGGFPCQDISFAGRGAGLEGERSGLWWEFARIVREMGPRFVVVENVAALRSRGLDAVLGTLASLGYDAEWHSMRASDVGAPHLRNRVFVLAYAHGHGPVESQRREQGERRRARDGGETMAHTERDGLQGAERSSTWEGTSGKPRRPTHTGGEILADALGSRWQRRGGPCGEHGGRAGSAIGSGSEAQSGVGRDPHGLSARVDRWPSRPDEAQQEWEPPRTAEKAANRGARLRALGNAVVPQVAEVIGRRVVELAAHRSR